MQHKKDPADVAADSYFEMQMSRGKRDRGVNYILIALFAAFIILLGALIFILPTSDFSEDENRTLQTMPSFSFDSLASGEFSRQIGLFYADQFPFRNTFVGIKAVSELAQLKFENNGVLLGKDGYLIKKLEYNDYSVAEDNLAAIKKFKEAAEESGVTTAVVIAPRTVDVVDDTLNPLFGFDRVNTIWKYVDESGVNSYDYKRMLTSKHYAFGGVFYKTDHHWTTFGAYHVYNDLSYDLKYKANNISHYEEETVTSDFYGTTYSSSGIKWASPDKIELYRYEGDTEFLCEIMSVDENGVPYAEESFNGFYKNDALKTKSKYDVFLGGNYGHLRITNPNATEERETLLIIKDSYANALIPFLAEHFDLEIIDPRFHHGGISSLTEKLDYDKALVLFNADTIATTEIDKIAK